MPIAYGKNELFLAWQSTDEFLNVMSSADGANFSGKRKLKERSLKSTRPAIAYGKGLLFLAWIDGEDKVNVMASPDGTYWNDKFIISETSHRKCSPALAYAHDRLYLAWTGLDHQHHLNITSFTVADDGELAEYGKVTLDEESTGEAGPALATANDHLYIAWQGRDDHINIVSSNNGKSFQNKKTLPEKSPSSATPGIAYGDGIFYVSWIGGDDKLNLVSSTDGTMWSNKVTIKEKSSNTGVAGLAYGSNSLFLDWSGHDHKHHLNVMTFKIGGTKGALPEGSLIVLEDEAEK